MPTTPPPPTMPSLKVVKSFTYRDVARQFSNRYFFSGGTPSDAGHWTALGDAVVTAEKACLIAGVVTIVEVLGYAAGSDVPVHIKSYTTGGTWTIGSFAQAPGDAAVLVRYATSARSVKNHPIYLFNYYHGVGIATTAGDLVAAGQRTAFQTYAGQWCGTGFSDGTITVKRTGPYGHDALGAVVNTYVHHRDFS